MRGATTWAAKMGTTSVAAVHDPLNDTGPVADREGGGVSLATGQARAGRKGSLAARTKGTACVGTAELKGGFAKVAAEKTGGTDKDAEEAEGLSRVAERQRGETRGPVWPAAVARGPGRIGLQRRDTRTS